MKRVLCFLALTALFAGVVERQCFGGIHPSLEDALELAAIGPNGIDLNPGEEVQLTIRITALKTPSSFSGIPSLLWEGGDFQINTGSDSVFGAAVTDPFITAGPGWNNNPPEGNTSRNFVGGGSSVTVFADFPPLFSMSRDLGTIILRAGSETGSFTTSFSNIVMITGDQAIPGSGLIGTVNVNFSYNVVPEPSAALLCLVSLTGLVIRRRNRV